MSRFPNCTNHDLITFCKLRRANLLAGGGYGCKVLITQKGGGFTGLSKVVSVCKKKVIHCGKNDWFLAKWLSSKSKNKKMSWGFSKLIFITMTTCQDSPGMLIVAAMMQLTKTVSASAEASLSSSCGKNLLHFQSGKTLTRSKPYQYKYEVFLLHQTVPTVCLCVFGGREGLRQTNYQRVQKKRAAK